MMSENTLRPTSNEVSLELVLKYSLYISKYFVGTKTILFTQQKKNLNFAGQNVGSSPENLVGRFIEARNSLFVFEIRNEIENPLEFLVNRTNGNIFDISQIDPKFSLILQRRAVFGVKMELKTSDSIRKSRVYGNTICDSFTPSFAQMDDESTVSYTFFIDEFMRDGQSVFLQAIVTYWTHSGEKRILVLNQRLVASAKYSTVYDFMAFDTVFAIIFRSIASRNASSQGRHIADWNKKIVNSLLFFRKKCSADSRPTELVLPESLKSLPNLFQALTKNRLLNITATNQNSNLLYLQRLSNKPVSKNLYYVYPRLIAFSDFFIDRNIKKCLQLSKKGLVDGEIYVMDNSEVIYIFLTKGVDEELVRMLFESVQQNYNTRSLGFRAQNAVLGNNTNPGNLILAEKDNEENRILNLLIEKINDSHRDVLDVKIVRQGNDVDVMGYFVEDDLNGVKAYSEFLSDIHFKIRGVK
ncbi:Protein transport protein Sec24-like CEF [Dictyocoela roeselum]|nr:Protein transport protein Sec24-like CEF [Dictyocoela roeselum]